MIDLSTDRLVTAVETASESIIGNGIVYKQHELQKLQEHFEEDSFFSEAVDIMKSNLCNPAMIRASFHYFYKEEFHRWATAAFLAMYVNTFERLPALIDIPHVKIIVGWRLKIGR